MVGRTLGHYEILEQLGQGGMGVVYKARDTHLGRLVVIKVLPPDRLADPGRRARFIQEARAASALNHPNIITVHDVAPEDGVDFIVMEYVPGQTLDRLVPRKGMRVAEALRCAVQIAGALSAAHRAGIVHRDLKPGNVMLGERGIVKVLDFGLAKLTEPAESGEFAETRTLKGSAAPSTGESKIVGTAAYMSPEQAEGKRVDPRSDIFSMGSLLYQMMTGRRAFQGDTHVSTLSAILRDDPKPVRALAEDVPPELERIISRCLRKDPDRRFQHMDDLKVALAELKEESDSGALGSSRAAKPAPGWIWWALGVIVALLAAGAGAWIWHAIAMRGKGAQPPVAVPLTSYRGSEDGPASRRTAGRWLSPGAGSRTTTSTFT